MGPLLNLALIALPLVAAQGIAISGPFSPGNIKTPDAVQAYDAAARSSDNRIGTIYAPGFQFVLNDSTIFPSIWNWTVIVADLAVPVPERDLGRPGADYSQGYHVVNTQHRLNWTVSSNATERNALQGKSLQTVLQDSNVTLRLGFLPLNYADGQIPKRGNEQSSDCMDIIGLACQRDLANAFLNDRSGIINTGSFPSCSRLVDTSATIVNMSNSAVPLNDGDSFYYSQTPLGNTGNKTLLQREVSTGLIQIWNFRFPITNGTQDSLTIRCLQKSAAGLSSQPMVKMAVATAVVVGMFVAFA